MLFMEAPLRIGWRPFLRPNSIIHLLNNSSFSILQMQQFLFHFTPGDQLRIRSQKGLAAPRSLDHMLRHTLLKSVENGLLLSTRRHDPKLQVAYIVEVLGIEGEDHQISVVLKEVDMRLRKKVFARARDAEAARRIIGLQNRKGSAAALQLAEVGGIDTRDLFTILCDNRAARKEGLPGLRFRA